MDNNSQTGEEKKAVHFIWIKSPLQAFLQTMDCRVLSSSNCGPRSIFSFILWPFIVGDHWSFRRSKVFWNLNFLGYFSASKFSSFFQLFLLFFWLQLIQTDCILGFVSKNSIKVNKLNNILYSIFNVFPLRYNKSHLSKNAIQFIYNVQFYLSGLIFFCGEGWEVWVTKNEMKIGTFKLY